MRSRRVSLCIAVLVITLGISAMAYAQSCGQTVTGTVTLAADLTCPTGHGLYVGTGATLDCAGHTITGGNQPGQYGIYVRHVRYATVRNCTVERFEIGIRLRAAFDIAVQGNVIRDNTAYGMEIILLSARALIQGNTISNNGDEGMHVSGPSYRAAGHSIIGNTLDANALEGIYLLRSHGNTIADNIVQNHASAGIYVKGASWNIIERNTLTNDDLQLVDGSGQNTLTDNTIRGGRHRFDGASANTVYRTSVEQQDHSPAEAYIFTNANANIIIDSAAINPVDYHIRAANGSTDNIFTRFLALPTLECFVDQESSVVVTDPAGNSLPCPSQ